jgi:hypothetical protein
LFLSSHSRSYLQHDVFAAQDDRFRFVSPATTFILMHEDGQSAHATEAHSQPPPPAIRRGRRLFLADE